MARAEGLFEHLLGPLRCLLHGEFLFAIVEARNDGEQFALSVRRSRPSAGEEIGIEFRLISSTGISLLSCI